MELAEIRYMGIFRKLLFRATVEKNKEFLTPIQHGEILTTDLGLTNY